jgi:hypothetical protein
VGVYIGSSFARKSLSSIVARLSGEVNANADGVAATTLVQLCGEKRNANHVLGVAVDSTADIAAVQRALSTWSRYGQCVDDLESVVASWDDISVWESTADLKPLFASINSTTAPASHGNSSHGNSSSSSSLTLRLHKRADCTTISVVANDGCDTLAARCGISAAEVTTYNSVTDTFCSNLVPNQRVCCTPGSLPDISPKPNADGSCATYLATDNDNCDTLAAQYGLTVELLERYNNGSTWGWNSCSNLFTGVNICLSSGTAPMPAPIDNAVCGPTKPGTALVFGVDLANLNPCPLNACCNIWGQCGVSADFCNPTRGPAGNPGTSRQEQQGAFQAAGRRLSRATRRPPVCRYCEDWNCGWNSDCEHNTGGGEGTVTPCPNIESRWENFTEPCAPDYSLRGETAPEAGYRWHEAVYWSLRRGHVLVRSVFRHGDQQG